MEKKIIIPIIFVLLAAYAQAACVNPSDGLVIKESTILCAGTYILPSGISVARSDIILDCNGAVLEGTLEGTGIYVKGHDGIILRNCVIETYDYGIYLEDSFDNEIVNSDIANSGIGIYMLGSYANIIETRLFNNEQDFVNFTAPSAPEKREIIPEVKVELPVDFTFENVVHQAVVDELEVREGYERAKDIVSISHRRIDKGDKLEYTLTIESEWEVLGLEIYEHIPKALTPSASLIESDTEFEIINDDPEIMFRLGRVKAGEKKVIVYEISKPELSEINPFSIASIERAINPTDSKIIRLFFALAIILILINHFLKREVEIKEGS